MLASAQGLEDKSARWLHAAHELNDDVHRGVVDESPRVVYENSLGQLDAAVAAGVEVGDAGQSNRKPQPVLMGLRTLPQQPHDTGTYGAVTDYAYADSSFHDPLPALSGPCSSAFLIPRMAWRVRCSFSIRAKRTYSSP